MALAVGALILAGLAWAVFVRSPTPSIAPDGSTNVGTSMPIAPVATPTVNASTNLPLMEINQAVMVTVELDFGGRVPTIAEALREVERRHQADDGGGRVFAILDAYGDPTPDGKKLHMSMHVSSEKPGIGSLIFKRTGEVLWRSRIVVTTNRSTFSGGSLTILYEDGAGKVFTVDGSANPASILQATLKESGLTVAETWPEGAERELTYLYSACGCPVKVKCRRAGDRTVRTKNARGEELPVIFPDDPAVVTLITPLMRW